MARDAKRSSCASGSPMALWCNQGRLHGSGRCAHPAERRNRGGLVMRSYSLELGAYRYEVECRPGDTPTARCRHYETGVTAEASGPTQYVARLRARERVDEIIEAEHLDSTGAIRRSSRQHVGSP